MPAEQPPIKQYFAEQNWPVCPMEDVLAGMAHLEAYLNTILAREDGDKNSAMAGIPMHGYLSRKGLLLHHGMER